MSPDLIQIPLLDRKPKKEPKSVKVKIDAEEKKAAKERKAPKEPFLFPHWCIYIAWFLTFASIIASSVVVIIYGMVFANSKSWEWISSITISLVSDILIIQPIKVGYFQCVPFVIKKQSSVNESEV